VRRPAVISASSDSSCRRQRGGAVMDPTRCQNLRILRALPTLTVPPLPSWSVLLAYFVCDPCLGPADGGHLVDELHHQSYARNTIVNSESYNSSRLSCPQVDWADSKGLNEWEPKASSCPEERSRIAYSASSAFPNEATTEARVGTKRYSDG
jgi:hypothetical protein